MVSELYREKQLILENLQANILKGHGRREAYLIFLRFPEDTKENIETQREIKAWILDSVLPYVTSAAQQLSDAAKKVDNQSHDGGLLGCFFLSANGYRALGYEDELKWFRGASFKKGMKTRENYYFQGGNERFSIDNKDPHPKYWQDSYQREIHAMLLLADNNKSELDKKRGEVEETLKGIAEEVWVEQGKRLFFKDTDKDREPFGYRDGISNPSFFSEEKQKDPVSHLYLPVAKELVLVPDPLALEAHCYGSYLVFRKLEQNIEAFEGLKERSATFERTRDLAGAQIVGRFPDGTPVTMFDQPQGLDVGNIDFNFEDDNGSRCPFHAHIRKVNPRDGSERTFQIVRRGIPYNEIDKDTGNEKIGMLFMCYQRNIHDQFEFIQRVWVDNFNHPVIGTGVDRLVGQDWSEESHCKSPVTLQGGEYFFAPSLSFLKNVGLPEKEASFLNHPKNMG
jgi:Dyp-type peroxidase family